jgi:RsiW-degrading membrane proteinase PrsW (M82 family)
MTFVFREDVARPPGIWRAGPLMVLLLGGFAAALMLVTGIVGLSLEGAALKAVNLGLALLPLGVWWVVYYLPARRRGRALRYTFGLMLLGGLLANGVAIPVINDVFAVDEWLVTASGLTRIIGYTLIVGFLQEYLKFAAVRYTVYPDGLSERGDGVAYGVIVSVGFAVVWGLRFFVDNGGSPLDAAALRVVSISLLQMATGAVNGYFLTTARFSREEPPVWWFALGVAVSALLNGLYVALRSGLVIGSFGIGSTANAPFLGLVGGVAAALVVFAVLAFLNRQAEAREAASPGTVLYR